MRLITSHIKRARQQEGGKLLLFQKLIEMSSCSTGGKSEGDKMNYMEYINQVGKRRRPALIREMTKMMGSAEPGTIFMAGGLPNPSLFPFQSLQVTMEEGIELNLDHNQLMAALQYQPTSGYPPLQRKLREMVTHLFNPPSMEDRELLVTVGSQNGLCGVLEMTMTLGDPIIIPQPVYSSVLNIMDPFLPKYLAVPEDADGMQPHLLSEMLEDCKAGGGPQPKILYVNPTGCNPSGIVIPTERKRQIYDIARHYRLLILEDDPYYFLHFQESSPQTFISMDIDGRVIRFDSFSKVLSSGLRVGFATGPRQLLRVLELSLQSSVLHATSLSQVLVDKVLAKWGVAGLEKHVHRVREFYKQRRDLMLLAAQKHLKGLAEWNTPQGGMFLWIKCLRVKDTYGMVMERGLEQRIMLLPGREFMGKREEPCPYVRASYSVLPLEHIDEGMQRLAKLIRQEEALHQ